MRVNELMSAEVLSVRPEQTLPEAVALMLQHGVSGLPVVDDEGRLVGVVTELDAIKSCVPPYMLQMRDYDFLHGDLGVLHRASRTFGERTVGEAMTDADLLTVEEEDAASEVALEMVQHGYTLVPVVREGMVVGVVTRADLVRAISRLSQEHGQQ
jgi:CBS domain-containing protein